MLPGKMRSRKSLKCAELGLADAKPGTDYPIGWHKKVRVDLATFAERLADGLERERGRVVNRG